MRLRLPSSLAAILTLTLALLFGPASYAAADTARSLAAVAAAAGKPAPIATLATASSPPPSFGTTVETRVTVGACEAAATVPVVQPALTRSGCGMAAPASDGLLTIGFPVHVPTGALITRVFVAYYDPLSSGEPFIGLFRSGAGNNSELVAELTMPAFNGGYQQVLFTLANPHQVENQYSYVILADLNRAGADYQGIEFISVYYQLQVSPAPAVATFGDVPTNHPFFQFVEALAASGITVGCGGGNFCPNQPLTRGQMAVFLAKALGLHFAF